MIETRNGVPTIGSPQPAQRLASFSVNTVGMRMPMIWPPRNRVTLMRAIVSEVGIAADRLVGVVSDPYDATDIALAGRNRGMPIEMLRYDITPVGTHYMLTHFDVPDLDVGEWRLQVGGRVRSSLALSLADLGAMASVTHPVTLECAGNGRSLLAPRPRNQPWGLEAVSTAEWTGVPLRAILDAAGLEPETVELVFTGADEGTQNGVRHHFARSLGVADARRPEVLLAYAMNGRALEPQHGAPVRLVVPGWYGMASVKWLTSIEAVTEPFSGYQQARSYTIRQQPDDPGERVTRIAVRALMSPARTTGLPDADARRRRRTRARARAGMVGRSRHRAGRGRRGRPVVRRHARRAGGRVRVARLVIRVGRAERVARRSHAGRPTPTVGHSRSSRYGTWAATPTTWPSASS